MIRLLRPKDAVVESVSALRVRDWVAFSETGPRMGMTRSGIAYRREK